MLLKLVAIVLMLIEGAVEAKTKPPHIVLMVLDDVGFADVSYHDSLFPTPTIDRLATKEGVRLERYYVQQVCSPTRSALLTGRYPFHTGLQHSTTLMPGSTAAIPMDIPTIAELLKAQGYRTSAIGKWHLGYASWKNTPTGRGFDSYAGFLQGAGDYYTHMLDVTGKGGGALDYWRNRTAVWTENGTYSSCFYSDEAQRVLESYETSDSAPPLFMYYAHQLLHEPLELPPGKKHSEVCEHINATDPDGFNRHKTCAMMNRLDSDIAQFESMLRAKGMWDDTLLWVTSDNGGMTQQTQASKVASASSNWPLRGLKTTLFEGGVRGVSFVTGGYVPEAMRGGVRHSLLQHVDVTHTIAALGGADRSRLGTDGFNIWDSVIVNASVAVDTSAVATTSVSQAFSPRVEAPLNVDTTNFGLENVNGNFSALISGKWKLINGRSGAPIQVDGWWTLGLPYEHIPVNGSTKEINVTMGGTTVFLFDLDTDPTEHVNLATDNPDIVESMQRRLKELASPHNGYRHPQPNLPHPEAAPKLHNGTWAPWL